MGFETHTAAVRGLGSFGEGQHSRSMDFRCFVFPDVESLRIRVATSRGIDLGEIPVDVLQSGVSSYRVHYDETGSVDFEMTLGKRTPLPLVRFSQINFWFGNRKFFNGYLWKTPGPERAVDQPFIYTGFGMKERFSKKKIQLREGIEWFRILSISVDGDEMVLETVEDIPEEIESDNVCFIEAVSDLNSGRFTLVSRSGNELRFLNTEAIAQATQSGLIYVLPSAWSNAATRFGELVAQVVENYFGSLPLSKWSNFIDPTSEIPIGDQVDLDGTEIGEFFEAIRMALPDWDLFTDVDGNIVLRPKDAAPREILIEGYDFPMMNETIDLDSIRNRIFVKKKNSKDSRRAGFSGEGFAEDATSIATVGELEESIEIQFADGENICQLIAEATLAISLDPKVTVKIKDAPFRIWETGLYRLIGAPKEQTSVLSECEDLSELTYDPEFVNASVETTRLIEGAGAFKFEFSETAFGKWVLFEGLSIPLLNPKILSFYWHGSFIGQKFTFGFGRTSPLENIREIEVMSGRWEKEEINLEEISPGARIGVMGIRFDDDDSFFGNAAYGGGPIGVPFAWPNEANGFMRIWIDQIEYTGTQSKHRDIELRDVILQKRDGIDSADLTFGSMQEAIDGYLADEFRKLKTAQFALKDR